MRRHALLSIFALFVVSSFAQTESSASGASDPSAAPAADATAAAAPADATAAAAPAADQQPAVDASAATAAAMAAIANVQAQQQLSGKYATLLLDYQSASGWLQVAQNWLALAKPKSHELEQQDLEEDDDEEDEDFVPGPGLFGAESSIPANNDGRAIEKNAERALLGVLKLMYLQASQKLHATHQSHYQTKIQMTLLQSTPAAASMGSLIYMMYYVETLRTMSSAVTIQRQDAWNYWLTLDMIESDMNGPVSEKFRTSLKKSRESAMQLYYTEATIDMQIFYLEYYLQMIASQIAASAAAAAAPAAAQPSAASFLETEMEPSKPFMPAMMMMGGAPYLSYYSMILKFWSVTMNVNAAQGLYLSAQVNANSGAKAGQTLYTAVTALQQWAYLKMQQAMIDMYGLFATMQGAPAMHANSAAAAAHSFVQTAQPLTSPENVQ